MTSKVALKVISVRTITPFFLTALLGLSISAALARGPQSVADIAEELQDAVVNISTSQTIKGSRGIPLPRVPEGSPFEEFFEEFFNKQNRQGPQRKVNSLGSGFVIDPSGIIVTNNHVIESAEEIIANFNDGTKLKVVEVLGRDSKTDIAVLRVEPKKPLKAVKFGDSTKMRVGDWVMAIGNPFGLGGSVTVGIISAKNRDIQSGPYDEYIQTDAAINRGNSGGPLFNMEGQVIGINTAIISPTGGSIGIGFAVPSNTASPVINQLQKYGETRRGWLGVRIQSVTEEIAESLGLGSDAGVLIANVTKDSPAAEAGIEAGDIIIRFGGKIIPTVRTLPRVVASAEIGSTVPVEVLRKGERKTVYVKIGRLPGDSQKQKKKKPTKTVREQVLLGLSIAPISDELRARFRLDKKIQGVVITKVERESVAAQKSIKPGDVIVEVTQEKVSLPTDVAERVDAVRQAGRKSVLLLISDSKGDLRFVAIPVEG